MDQNEPPLTYCDANESSETRGSNSALSSLLWKLASGVRLGMGGGD